MNLHQPLKTTSQLLTSHVRSAFAADHMLSIATIWSFHCQESVVKLGGTAI
jgi:hypothetical protein